MPLKLSLLPGQLAQLFLLFFKNYFGGHFFKNHEARPKQHQNSHNNRHQNRIARDITTCVLYQNRPTQSAASNGKLLLAFHGHYWHNCFYYYYCYYCYFYLHIAERTNVPMYTISMHCIFLGRILFLLKSFSSHFDTDAHDKSQPCLFQSTFLSAYNLLGFALLFLQIIKGMGFTFPPSRFV